MREEGLLKVQMDEEIKMVDKKKKGQGKGPKGFVHEEEKRRQRRPMTPRWCCKRK
jgi:hypothetical protein